MRIGALNELQYRVNFFLSLVQSVVAVATALVALALVFAHTDSLGGWSSDELLVIMGVYVLMGGVIRLGAFGKGQRNSETDQGGSGDAVHAPLYARAAQPRPHHVRSRDDQAEPKDSLDVVHGGQQHSHQHRGDIGRDELWQQAT